LTQRAFLSRQVSQRQQAEYAGESYMEPCTRLTHSCASYVVMLTLMRHVEQFGCPYETAGVDHLPKNPDARECIHSARAPCPFVLESSMSQL
jgi:hypothetical protein